LSGATVAAAKMLPASLISSLDPEQIEALIDALQSTLAVLRVRYESARYANARQAGYEARAALARAARTHNATERRLVVWRLARRGLTNADIAARLGISTRTVERALASLPAPG